MITIELDGAPRGKGRPRFRVIKTGNSAFASAYTDAKTRAYETQLRAAAAKAMVGLQPLTGPLVVEVVAYFPIPSSWSKKQKLAAEAGDIVPITKPDVDNVIKTLDAFNEIVWVDDSQVVGCTVWKFYSIEPRLSVRVKTYHEHIGASHGSQDSESDRGEPELPLENAGHLV